MPFSPVYLSVIFAENARVKNSGVYKIIETSGVYNTPCSVRDNYSRTKNVLEGYHSALRHGRIKVIDRNLYAFLDDLQQTTSDQLNDVARISINQSIKQVYCTEPCHTHTINLTNKNKMGKKSHMNIYR